MGSLKVKILFNPSIIMYLVIVDKFVKDKAGLIKIRPTEKFFDMVHEEVVSYMAEGAEPPAAIAPAIMNIADDMMAGRDVVIRTGDYISLMEFARAKKRL